MVLLPAAVVVCLEVCTHNKQHMCRNSKRQRKSVAMNSFAVLDAYGGVEPVVTEFLADSM